MLTFRATYELVTAIGETLTYEPTPHVLTFQIASESHARTEAAKLAQMLRPERFTKVIENGVVVGSQWLEADVEAIY